MVCGCMTLIDFFVFGIHRRVSLIEFAVHDWWHVVFSTSTTNSRNISLIDLKKHCEVTTVQVTSIKTIVWAFLLWWPTKYFFESFGKILVHLRLLQFVQFKLVGEDSSGTKKSKNYQASSRSLIENLSRNSRNETCFVSGDSICSSLVNDVYRFI